MDEPSAREKIYWKVFNTGARVFGFGLTIISIIFTVLVTGSILGLPEFEDYPGWLLILFVPLVPLGVLVVKAKIYYPEQYKEYYERDLH